MKTEIKLSDKAIKFYCDWNSITLEDVSEIDRYEIKCMEQFAQQEKRVLLEWIEEHLGFDAWFGNVDIDIILSQFNEWKSNQQEGER